jgi:pimeloyl-ACP methyl ester carboxylesterase
MTGRLRRMGASTALTAIALVAATVAAPPVHGGTTGTSAPGANGDFAGTVELPTGRAMYVVCRGKGRPTVWLEGGLHSTADVWLLPADPAQTQETVLPALARETRVCAYDRPGTAIATDMTSRSDPVRMPRTTAEMVTDLRALQRVAKVPGPYVFVAHSMGGLVARQYTSLHADDIVGLVLVEALPETMESRQSVSDWNAYDQFLLAVPNGLGPIPTTRPSTSVAASPRCGRWG